MKKSVPVFVVIILLSSFLYPADNKKAFKKLFSLEGVWKMATKKGAMYEEWKSVNKSYLQNKGYMVKGADTIINERVALTRNREGVFYTSTVEEQNNKQSIAFKMT